MQARHRGVGIAGEADQPRGVFCGRLAGKGIPESVGGEEAWWCRRVREVAHQPQAVGDQNRVAEAAVGLAVSEIRVGQGRNEQYELGQPVAGAERVLERRADRQTALQRSFEERMQLPLQRDDCSPVGKGPGPVLPCHAPRRLVGEPERDPDADLRQQVNWPIRRYGP